MIWFQIFLYGVLALIAACLIRVAARWGLRRTAATVFPELVFFDCQERFAEFWRAARNRPTLVWSLVVDIPVFAGVILWAKLFLGQPGLLGPVGFVLAAGLAMLASMTIPALLARNHIRSMLRQALWARGVRVCQSCGMDLRGEDVHICPRCGGPIEGTPASLPSLGP